MTSCILLHHENTGVRKGISHYSSPYPVYLPPSQQNWRRGLLLPPLLSPICVCFQSSLNTPLINFLIKLPCSYGIFLLPLRHSQASQSHVCSPLPPTSLSKVFKGIMFLCSAGLTKHAPWCLTASLPTGSSLSLSQLCLPPVSSFA